jgi:hypothetical protein
MRRLKSSSIRARGSLFRTPADPLTSLPSPYVAQSIGLSMPWAHRRNRHKGVRTGSPRIRISSEFLGWSAILTNCCGDAICQRTGRVLTILSSGCLSKHLPNFDDVARRAGLLRSALVQLRYIVRGKRSDPALRSNNKKTCCGLRQRHCQGRKERAGVRSTHPTEVFRRLGAVRGGR